MTCRPKSALPVLMLWATSAVYGHGITWENLPTGGLFDVMSFVHGPQISDDFVPALGPNRFHVLDWWGSEARSSEWTIEAVGLPGQDPPRWSTTGAYAEGSADPAYPGLYHYRAYGTWYLPDDYRHTPSWITIANSEPGWYWAVGSPEPGLGRQENSARVYDGQQWRDTGTNMAFRLTYVPEPSAALLAAFGLLAFGVFRWRGSRRVALIRWVPCALALSLGFGGVANAGVMRFEGLPSAVAPAFYEEDGIRFSLVQGDYYPFDCRLIMGVCPPSNGIVAGLDALEQGQSTVRITLIDGGLFNLDGIEILAAGDPFSFIEASNGSRFELFFEAVELSGFRRIQFFDITSSSDHILGGFLVDNIAVTPVPEAQASMLLFPALVTLAILRRARAHWFVNYHETNARH